MKIVHGVTRSVILTERLAIKLPWGQGHMPLRGWMANRSEWHQRYRLDVNPPGASLLHLALVSRRISTVDDWEQWDLEVMPWLVFCGYSAEEAKPSSWGLFNDRWLLIDYDRCWQHPRGLVGGIYYWNQERLARKWLTTDSTGSSSS